MAAVPAPPAPPAQRNLPALSPNYMVDQVEACKSSTDLLKLSWIRVSTDGVQGVQSTGGSLFRVFNLTALSWLVLTLVKIKVFNTI